MKMSIDGEEYVGLEEIKKLVNMNKTSIYTLMKFGYFPKPKKLAERAVWKQSEIEEYIESKRK